VPSVWNRPWAAIQRSGCAGRGRGAGGCESGCADAWIRKTFCELCCRIAHNSGLPDNQPTVETGPNTCCRTARQHANNTTYELMVEHPRGRPVVPPLRYVVSRRGFEPGISCHFCVRVYRYRPVAGWKHQTTGVDHRSIAVVKVPGREASHFSYENRLSWGKTNLEHRGSKHAPGCPSLEQKQEESDPARSSSHI
jgi:hypothetical protein